MKILADYQKKMIKKHGVLEIGEIPTTELISEIRNYIYNEYYEIIKID